MARKSTGIATDACQRLSTRCGHLLRPFASHAFDDVAAAQYALVRHQLEVAGQTIGPFDLQIAAICLCLDLTLVTNNVSEFSRVKGLRVEDWLAAVEWATDTLGVENKAGSVTAEQLHEAILVAQQMFISDVIGREGLRILRILRSMLSMKSVLAHLHMSIKEGSGAGTYLVQQLINAFLWTG
jgi:hypothetical protein